MSEEKKNYIKVFIVLDACILQTVDKNHTAIKSLKMQSCSSVDLLKDKKVKLNKRNKYEFEACLE